MHRTPGPAPGGRAARAAIALAVSLLSGAACRRPGARHGAATELVCIQERAPETLDPHGRGTISQTQEVLANAYEGVVSLDPQMAVVPALATSWTNPDESTWELTLRTDAAFHTGGTMTAGDVVYSFERARRNAHTALVDLESIVEIRGGVRLRTRTPDASLLGKLRDVYVVSRRFVETEGEAALLRRSAGTGPFALESMAAEGSVSARAFDGAWSGRPAIARVRFVTRTLTARDIPALASSGTPHLFYLRPSSPAAAAAEPLFDKTPVSSLSIAYLGFDLHAAESPFVTLPDGSHRNPFLDARVRGAVALALDLEGLRASVGNGFVPTQMFPSSVFGFAPDLPAPARDLARARSLLASTPFAGGFRVRFDYRELMSDLAAPIVKDLAALGLTIDGNPLEDTRFFEVLEGEGSSLYLLRFSCRYGDAQELYDRWARSLDAAAGLGVSNYSYRKSPIEGLDAAIDAGRRDLRVETRQVKLQQISRTLTEQRIAVPVHQYQEVLYASRGLRVTPRLDTYRLLGTATLAR